MEKIVDAFEFRRNIGKILQHIAARSDNYIVERYGEPVEVYELWERRRKRLFEQLRRSQKNANLSP